MIAIGGISLVLGIVGIVLPVLPTTPFILLSLFCFGKSSQRLHDWLISHPRVGPEIHAWRNHGAISKKAKISAVTLMAAGMIFSIAVGLKPIILIVQGTIISSVALFLITRPMPPKSGS
ncbi:MAG: YbaN family protein [Rhizobiaceae bacterium]